MRDPPKVAMDSWGNGSPWARQLREDEGFKRSFSGVLGNLKPKPQKLELGLHRG